MVDTLVKGKTVTLKRQYSFIEDANKDPEVKGYFDMSFRSVGSYSRNAGGPPASGLTRLEERAIMPVITGIYPEDGRREFADSVNTFFKNFNTKVPAEGVKLQIGLEDPTKPVGFADPNDLESPINYPINPLEYVRWRHAIGHPKVAADKDTAERHQHIMFYIQDEDAVIKATSKLHKLEDEARKEYFKIIEDRAKVDQILTLLGVPNAKKLDAETAELALKGYSTINTEEGEETNAAKLTKFKSVATDKELAIKYDIMQLISIGVLEQVGSRILVKESSEQIGVNLKEAAKWMMDKSNVQLIGAWKAQLEEFGGSKMASQS